MLKGSAEQHLLEMRSRRQPVLVRYTGPSPHLEWVYDPADIDAAPVIWVHDLGEAENERLRRYYPDDPFGFSNLIVDENAALTS